MKIIYTKDKEFRTEFENILKRAKSDIKGVSKIVENIIDEIVEDGNEALKRHIEKFDKWIVKSDDELKTIMTLSDAKRVFNLFHNLVLQKNQQKLIGQQGKNKQSVAPTVLGNTVTEKGSVIVVKKKPKKD